MQPHDVLRATAGPLGDIGAAFYFTPETRAAAKQEFGLDGFRNYFLGRGGVLGAVDADVVSAAFGYFEPNLIRNLWDSGIERIAPRSPRDVARAFIASAHEFGRARFAGLDGLAEFAEAAGAVIGSVEAAALPLFAGVRAEPVPDDAPAAAMHQAMVLRELRGSTHLVAVVASGLRTSIAHAIKRPTETEMFGYTPDAAETVTHEQRAAWDRAEQLTDDLLAPAYAGLSDAQATALVDGAQAMHAALAA